MVTSIKIQKEQTSAPSKTGWGPDIQSAGYAKNGTDELNVFRTLTLVETELIKKWFKFVPIATENFHVYPNVKTESNVLVKSDIPTMRTKDDAKK